MSAGGALVVRAIDALLSIDGIPAEQAESIAGQWARCRVTPGPGTTVATVHAPVQTEESAGAFGHVLQSTVTQAAIAQATGRLLLLHAGAVADPQGRVLVLVGASGAGKSTAVTRLAGAAGWGYVTDETVAIAADHTVVPYPKPLSRVQPPSPRYDPGWDLRDKDSVGPDDLGLGRPPAHLRLAAVVILDRRVEPTPPRLLPVSLVEAAFPLVEGSSGLLALPRPLEALARALDAAGGAHRLVYSEIDEAADLLAGLVGGMPSAASAWTPLDPDPDPTRVPGDRAGRPGQVRRARLVAGLREGADLLLLVGTAPVRVSGIGTDIWTAAATWTDPEALLAPVIAAHGDHPDAPDRVRTAVDDLVAAGVLLRATHADA